MRRVVVWVGLLAMGLSGCGQSGDAEQGASAQVPEMTIELHDATGQGFRMTSGPDECDIRAPHLGDPSGTPTEKHICEPDPRDFSDVVKADCECEPEVLRPYFDHNMASTPLNTMQMYTPPDSRHYYPGVPSAKNWEHGVTEHRFEFDVRLTNGYDRDFEHVQVVLAEISPHEGRRALGDDSPHRCLKDDLGVWNFGPISAGETVTRTLKLWLPDDEPFTIVGFILDVECP